MTIAVPSSEASEIAQIRLSDEDWEALESLTPKQRAFVLEYPVDFNATAAAKRAGYLGTENALGVRGFTVLRHPVANPLIRKLTRATADELGVTAEWVIVKLYQLLERVALDGETWSPQTAVRVLEMIAKLRGDMIERVDVTQRTVEIRINGADLKDLT